MLSYEKTGSRYEIRGTRGDAENFYKKRGVFVTSVFFPFVPTKRILLSTIRLGGWSPSLSREGNVLHAFPCSNNVESTFHQADDQTGSLWWLPFRLQRENISMLSYEKTGSRYEIRGTRGMRKIFIKWLYRTFLFFPML